MTGPRLGLPNLGDGVGLRDIHYRYLLETPPEHWHVDWFEIVSENFFDDHGFSAHVLHHVAAHRPVVMHGVSLSIGGADPLDRRYLDKLAALAERIRPAWVSDHLCWTGFNGKVSHDLLPLPFTPRCLAHVADRVRAVQDHLGRPLILENPSTYLEFRSSEIPEWEFLGMLAEETGCGLLLDVNNAYVGAYNHGFDPVAYIEALPADHIVQMHLAGCRNHGTYLLDTHDQAVPDDVWSLYARAHARTAGVATLLEWDADIPAFPDLVTELAKAKSVRGAPPTEITATEIAATRITATEITATEITSAVPAAAAPQPRGRPPSPWVIADRPKRQIEPDLPSLQEWMLAVCTPGSDITEFAPRIPVSPHGITPALAIRTRPGRLPQASLDVYARGYLARLQECLRSEFPALRALVGDQVFDLFCRAYIADRPPASPSLFDFGAGFPSYLEDTRPQPPGPPTASDAIPAALARLERSRLEARRAPGIETDPMHRPIDGVTLITAAGGLIARIPGSLRLLRLEFALADTLAWADRMANQDRHPHPDPHPDPDPPDPPGPDPDRDG